jgi:hypothetical protein
LNRVPVEPIEPFPVEPVEPLSRMLTYADVCLFVRQRFNRFYSPWFFRNVQKKRGSMLRDPLSVREGTFVPVSKYVCTSKQVGKCTESVRDKRFHSKSTCSAMTGAASGWPPTKCLPSSAALSGSSYYYTTILLYILLYMCPYTPMYMFCMASYQMPSFVGRSVGFLILLLLYCYIYYYVCVLILLYTYILEYKGTYSSIYSSINRVPYTTKVLYILLYMCPYTPMYMFWMAPTQCHFFFLFCCLP